MDSDLRITKPGLEDRVSEIERRLGIAGPGIESRRRPPRSSARPSHNLTARLPVEWRRAIVALLKPGEMDTRWLAGVVKRRIDGPRVLPRPLQPGPKIRIVAWVPLEIQARAKARAWADSARSLSQWLAWVVAEELGL